MQRLRAVLLITAAILAPLGLAFPHFIFAALLLLIVRAGLNGIGIRRVGARFALLVLFPALVLMCEAIAADRGLLTYPAVKYLTPRLYLFSLDTAALLLLAALAAGMGVVAELTARLRSRILAWLILTAALLAPFFLIPAPAVVYIRRTLLAAILAAGALYLQKTTASVRWFSGVALGAALAVLGSVRDIPALIAVGLAIAAGGAGIAIRTRLAQRQSTAAHER